MNIGQIMETHLGWAGMELGRQLADLVASGKPMEGIRTEAKAVFATEETDALIDGLSDDDLAKALKELKNGIVAKTPVFDGATEDELWG